jgi:hypothetical protein
MGGAPAPLAVSEQMGHPARPQPRAAIRFSRRVELLMRAKYELSN